MDELSYTVRRSPRARRARLVVRPEGVELVLPRRTALRAVQPWVDSRRPWVEAQVERLRQAAVDGPGTRLEDGGSVPYLGSELGLRVLVEPDRRRSSVRRHGHEVEVRVAEPGPQPLRDALERWYRAEARRAVAPRLAAACARAGHEPGPLTVRGQRTRWASCSSSGAMSFNWRLMLAPEAVLDYVVEHEVAHLDVADHGPRFRALLASRCPEHRLHEQWLRRHGPALRL